MIEWQVKAPSGEKRMPNKQPIRDQIYVIGWGLASLKIRTLYVVGESKKKVTQLDRLPCL